MTVERYCSSQVEDLAGIYGSTRRWVGGTVDV